MKSKLLLISLLFIFGIVVASDWNGVLKIRDHWDAHFKVNPKTRVYIISSDRKLNLPIGATEQKRIDIPETYKRIPVSEVEFNISITGELTGNE